VVSAFSAAFAFDLGGTLLLSDIFATVKKNRTGNGIDHCEVATAAVFWQNLA
jgi:hypothetical protein